MRLLRRVSITAEAARLRKMMTNDENRPLCQPADLGRPIPDSPHAVSVCLPTWADNVGYEKADPRVTGRMQCGYPRFFLHPRVVRLFQACEARFARPGECCFAFPSRRVAERCVDFVRKETGVDGSVNAWEPHSVYAVTVPNEARDTVKAYWQHTGQIVSSRQAERILSGQPGHGGRRSGEAGDPRAIGPLDASRSGRHLAFSLRHGCD